MSPGGITWRQCLRDLCALNSDYLGANLQNRRLVSRISKILVCLYVAFLGTQPICIRAFAQVPKQNVSSTADVKKPPTYPTSAETSTAITKSKWSRIGSFLANRDALTVVTFCAVTVFVVLWPIVRFLITQWDFRRVRIFGALSGDAVVYYYKQFRPGAQVLKTVLPDKNTDNTDKHVFTTKVREAYFQAFKGDFYRWYGRRYYLAPVTILAILTTVSACWGQVMLRKWASEQLGPGTGLRALVASALAGAFVWVISDEFDRLRRRDFTTTDVYYYNFRILIAIPFAWAIAAISVEGKPLGLPGSIPLAFFLGAFPTSTLFRIARRFGSQQLKLGDDQNNGALELEKLQSIGKTNAERFSDEGISTICALAYADPIDLTIRTNFDFNYVIDCVSQSLVWIYFQDDCSRLIKFSMRGAQEVIWILEWADDNTQPERQAWARKSLLDAATALNMSEDAFRTTLEQVFVDPYAKFLVDIWC